MLSLQLIIGLGVAGAALPDIIRFVKGRHDEEVPKYFKTTRFWVSLVILMAIGGLACWLGQPKSIQEALAYGYGAPEILSKMLSTPQPAGSTLNQADRGLMSIREWWGR